MKEEMDGSLRETINAVDRIAAELNAYRRLYPEPPPHIIEEELQIQIARYAKPPQEAEKKGRKEEGGILQVQGNVIQFPGR